MTWTLTTSGACTQEAGVNANGTLAASGAYLAALEDKAEGTVNSLTRYDWVANYASVGANFKGMLSDIVSQMVAMKIIKDDMSGFTNQAEARTMLDVLQNNINQNLLALKDQKIQEVMV